MRLVLLGNAGAGKSTLARRLAEREVRAGRGELPLLSLDDIAWDPGPRRRPLADSLADLRAFLARGERWIVEGCYGDLVEAALPACTELVLLDPGVEACVEHCRRRPWEPDKFPSRAEQDALLEPLLAWVREYETRDDEYGRARHLRIFEAFRGPKRRLADGRAYPAG